MTPARIMAAIIFVFVGLSILNILYTHNRMAALTYRTPSAIAPESTNAIDRVFANSTDSQLTVERNNGIYREIALVIVVGISLILGPKSPSSKSST